MVFRSRITVQTFMESRRQTTIPASGRNTCPSLKRTFAFAWTSRFPSIRVDTVDEPPLPKGVAYSDCWQRFVEAWQVCSEKAEKEGVLVVWEFEPGFAFNRPDEIARMVREISHPNFKVLFDSCHAHMCASVGARQEKPVETLTGGEQDLAQLLCGSIGYVHLIDSDNTLHDGWTSTHAPFGAGVIDFDALVKSIITAGYAGDWWTVDLCFWPGSVGHLAGIQGFCQRSSEKEQLAVRQLQEEVQTMKIGHQTYSWEMQGNSWRGTPDDIMDVIAAADYQGVEFSNAMIGSYWDRPEDFRKALTKRGLTLAAFAFGRNGFTDPATYDEDFAAAVKALDFAAHFSVVVSIAGPSSPSRADLEKKFARAYKFLNAVAEQGKKRGVTVAVHPHSHHTSLVTTGEDYDRLLAATESSGLMFNPDTGHIIRGQQDPLECCKRHRARIVHVHCKDVDRQGNWKLMGKGVCDFPSLFKWLGQTGYDGWLISEEESDVVWKDVAAAIAQNRAYFRSLGY